jgi:hypothetical protein
LVPIEYTEPSAVLLSAREELHFRNINRAHYTISNMADLNAVVDLGDSDRSSRLVSGALLEDTPRA